jgi:hypothetical protein
VQRAARPASHGRWRRAGGARKRYRGPQRDSRDHGRDAHLHPQGRQAHSPAPWRPTRPRRRCQRRRRCGGRRARGTYTGVGNHTLLVHCEPCPKHRPVRLGQLNRGSGQPPAKPGQGPRAAAQAGPCQRFRHGVVLAVRVKNRVKLAGCGHQVRLLFHVEQLPRFKWPAEESRLGARPVRVSYLGSRGRVEPREIACNAVHRARRTGARVQRIAHRWHRRRHSKTGIPNLHALQTALR